MDKKDIFSNPNPMDWVSQFLDNNPFPNAVRTNTEEFLKAQDEMVEDLRYYLENWCARRHQGTKEALECTRLFAGDTDIQNRGDAWNKWFAGFAKRVSDDTLDQLEISQKMLNHFLFGGLAGPFGLSALGPDVTLEKNGETSRLVSREA